MTASTGKVAAGVHDFTLRSAFHLPVKSGMKSYKYKKPSDKTLIMRNKYQYLKVLIIDEISMIGRETFGHLDVALKAIIQNLLPFVTICYQFLPPVNQKGVFMKSSNRSYSSFNEWL